MAFVDCAEVREFMAKFPTDFILEQSLFNEGFFVTDARCHKCQRQMTLRTKNSFLQWRCRKSGKECSSRSIRTHSCFANTRMEMRTVISLFIMWSREYSITDIVSTIKVTATTAAEFRDMLRVLCAEVHLSYGAIGGKNKVVEVGECYIQNKSDPSVGHFILAGREIGTGNVFAEVINNLSKKELDEMIMNKIHPESLLITNLCDNYPALKDFVAYDASKHEKQCLEVNSSQTYCSENLNDFWQKVRTNVPLTRDKDDYDNFKPYLSELVVRANEKDNFGPRMLEKIRTYRN